LLRIKKILKPVNVPDKTELKFRLNIIDRIKVLYYETKTNGEKKMFDAIKKMLITKIVQWLMKIAGTWFVALGVSQNSIEEIISGAVAVLLSMIWSLIYTGKVALKDPKEFVKFK
jgi:hypothetical protein